MTRIVGLEEDQEQELLAIYSEFFETKQKFLKHEVEKTPEQKEIIDFINQKLPEFLRRYGAEPLNISEDKVHILSPDQFRGSTEGIYLPGDQTIYIKDSKDCPLLGFAKRLMHEYLHFNSFQSIQSRKKAKELKTRRWGFKIIPKDAPEYAYFHDADEALMEELTKRFSKEFLVQMPVLQDDLRNLEINKQDFEAMRARMNLSEEEMANLISDLAYMQVVKKTGDQQEEYYEATLYGYCYPEARKKLNGLITELYEKNKNDFQSQEEVFDLFAKAALSGRLLPIVRLIEKTFGKGSFRRLGEEFGGKMKKV